MGVALLFECTVPTVALPTFLCVQAFTDKNYPVESNQAKWISMIVDFFVDSIISTVSGRLISTVSSRLVANSTFFHSPPPPPLPVFFLCR